MRISEAGFTPEVEKMLKLLDAAKNADCMIRDTSADGVDGRKVKNRRACRHRDWSEVIGFESGPEVELDGA